MTRAPEPATSRQGAVGDSVRSGVGLLVAVVSAVPILLFVGYAAIRLRYPYDLQWMEGSSVDIARRVADGQPLYTAPSLEYVSWPYPPLYYWLAGGVLRVVDDGYLAVRLVSLTAALAVLVLIGVIVARRSALALAGLLAAGAYAATFQLSGSWADTGRVDSLMLALVLAGVLACGRAVSWRGGIAAGVLLGAAVMTKQNAVLVVVPVLLALGVRRRAAALSAGITSLLVVAVPSGVEQWRSDGWYGEVVGRQLLGHGVATDRLWGFWLVDVSLPLAGLLLVIGYAVAVQRRRGGVPRWWLLATDHELVACAGLLLIAWSGRLHAGGFRNVLMPAYAAVAILAGLALAQLWRSGELSRRLPGFAVTATLAIQLGLLSAPWFPSVPTAADAAAGQAFVGKVAATPGRVVVLGHPWYAALAGKQTNAHVIGIADVLDGGSGRARTALLADLPSSLDEVDVVILDEISDGDPLQPALDRDFRLVSSAAVPGDAFWPISDIPRRPTYVYVRRDAGPREAQPWQ